MDFCDLIILLIYIQNSRFDAEQRTKCIVLQVMSFKFSFHSEKNHNIKKNVAQRAVWSNCVHSCADGHH